MSFLDGNFEYEEGQRLEFKEASGGLPDDLWETYSAFANTEGGEIVLGVREDKDARAFVPVGVPDSTDLVDIFWGIVRNPEKVSRDVTLADGVRAITRDGLDFVVIAVPRAERDQKPVAVYDRKSKGLVAYVSTPSVGIELSSRATNRVAPGIPIRSRTFCTMSGRLPNVARCGSVICLSFIISALCYRLTMSDREV